MAKALESQLQTPDLNNLPFEDRLGLMVDQELTMRENQRLAARLRHAKLRQQACIEDLDLKRMRGLDRGTVASLADSQWVSLHRNLLVTGKTGVGKSYVACAFAHKACRDGYTAAYHRAGRLFDELTVARATGVYPRFLNALSKKDVLVLDDFALVPLTLDQRRDLLEILDDRYEQKSTIVVSQIPHEEWYQMIGDATFADAILDRLVHNAYKICLTGPSGREGKMKEEKNGK